MRKCSPKMKIVSKQIFLEMLNLVNPRNGKTLLTTNARGEFRDAGFVVCNKEHKSKDKTHYVQEDLYEIYLELKRLKEIEKESAKKVEQQLYNK